MIRLSYPVSPLTQFRLRLELAARRTRRALEERRRMLGAEAQARQAEHQRLQWTQELQRERRVCTEFTAQYDALVGLLCAAAHEGLTEEMETEYRVLSAWFRTHYPRVQRAVAPHLTADASDVVTGRFGRRVCDGFEALFLPHSIAAMLAADEGNLIGRLMRTQTALGAWEEHLRRREAACRSAAPRPR